MRPQLRRMTTNRCSRLNSMTLFSMPSLPAAAGADGSLEDLGLEEEAPRGPHLLADLQARPGQLDEAPQLLSHEHATRLEFGRPPADEDDERASLPLDGLARNEERCARAAHLDFAGPEHVGPEEAAAVLDLRAHADEAGPIVHLGVDPEDLSRERGLRESRHLERDRLAGLDALEVELLDLEMHPHAVEIRDHEELRRRSHRLAHREAAPHHGPPERGKDPQSIPLALIFVPQAIELFLAETQAPEPLLGLHLLRLGAHQLGF